VTETERRNRNRELAIFGESLSREQVSILKEPMEKRLHRSTAWRSARAEPTPLSARRRQSSFIPFSLCFPAANICCPRDVLAGGLARPPGLLAAHLLASLFLFINKVKITKMDSNICVARKTYQSLISRFNRMRSN
jgi:hypothetical protein